MLPFLLYLLVVSWHTCTAKDEETTPRFTVDDQLAKIDVMFQFQQILWLEEMDPHPDEKKIKEIIKVRTKADTDFKKYGQEAREKLKEWFALREIKRLFPEKKATTKKAKSVAKSEGKNATGKTRKVRSTTKKVRSTRKKAEQSEEDE